ncbi:MAG: HigA family addiction module antitoxin [Vicinamibacterales bacterium]
MARDKAPVGDLRRFKRPPAHPGEVFREDYRQVGTDEEISQAECARRMGITQNRLNEIERGRRGVSPETAVLLDALTGVSAETWLTMQMRHDLWHAMQSTDTSKVQPFPRRTLQEPRATRRS